MTPTKEQYQKAAAFCGVGGSYADAHWRIPLDMPSASHPSTVMWRPHADWQDGGPLLAKVEKWLDHHRIVIMDLPLNGHMRIIMSDYSKAKFSGNEQQWLEAGFLLSVAIQESAK